MVHQPKHRQTGHGTDKIHIGHTTDRLVKDRIESTSVKLQTDWTMNE